MAGMDLWQIGLALAITAFAGFVKGAVGFAMPMILMSALGSFLPAPTALALLIVPTIFVNIAQAFRQGVPAAWASTVKYRLHIAMVMVFLVLSAQFVGAIPQALMYAALGLPILGFALWQLAGRSLAVPTHHRTALEAVLGVVGGLYGGISGIWGPPLIVYLISIGAGKQETVRVQGVVFLIGAVVLFFAHLASGVLDAQTLPLSALMTVPAMLGLWAGFRLQDRLDVAQFRRWTLVLLVLTAVNLLRRATGL